MADRLEDEGTMDRARTAAMRSAVITTAFGMLLLLGALAHQGQATAGVVVCEPDNFAAGTDLTNACPGATLSVVGSDAAGASPVRAGVPTNGFTSTGTLGFVDQIHTDWLDTTNRLRVEFQNPASWVSIDFIGNSCDGMNAPPDYDCLIEDDYYVDQGGVADSGKLWAYTSAGVLIGTVTTPGLAFGEVFTATFSAPGIAYVAFGSEFNDNWINLDRLRYIVSAPATISLLGIGLAGLGLARRRTAK